MNRVLSSLLLAATVSLAFIPFSSTAQVNRQQTSFGAFQQTLNQIVRTRRGAAAQNAIAAAYLRFARMNPQLAFSLARVATIQLNRVTPPAQRAAMAIRLANLTSSALIATGYNDTSVIVSTFTYLVSNLPPDSRNPDTIGAITSAAIEANVATGGTPESSLEIWNAIDTGAVTPPPVS